MHCNFSYRFLALSPDNILQLQSTHFVSSQKDKLTPRDSGDHTSTFDRSHIFHTLSLSGKPLFCLCPYY